MATSAKVESTRTDCLKGKVGIDQISDVVKDKSEWISEDKDGKFCCVKCNGKTFDSRKEIKKHMSLHCKYCIYVSTNLRHLKTHERSHIGEKPYACEYCDYVTCTSGNLNRHMLTHTNTRPFPCPSCEYNARTSSDLKKHVLIHTGEKPYQCQKCGRKFSRLGNLKQHNRKVVC